MVSGDFLRGTFSRAVVRDVGNTEPFTSDGTGTERITVDSQGGRIQTSCPGDPERVGVPMVQGVGVVGKGELLSCIGYMSA